MENWRTVPSDQLKSVDMTQEFVNWGELSPLLFDEKFTTSCHVYSLCEQHDILKWSSRERVLAGRKYSHQSVMKLSRYLTSDDHGV